MLRAERVSAATGSTRFTDVRTLPEVGSTNRLVADAALAGAPEGLVVVADHQTAGRGRLGRTWEAPPGTALLVSVLLRPDPPPPDAHLVTAAVGLAAQEACATVAGVVAELKWPNDLLVGDAKLAGILAEAGPALRGLAAPIVVGMGLNVSAAPPGAIDLTTAASAVGRRLDAGEAEDLLIATLIALDRRLDDWNRTAEEYRERCATVGRRVRVTLGRGEVVGEATALDGHGRLIVAPDGGGDDVVIDAGDVTHLRPA